MNYFSKASLLPLLIAPLFGLIDIPGIRMAFDDPDEESSAPLVAFLLISVGLDTFFVLLGFNTSNEGTTIAFLSMIYGSFIALLFLKVYGDAGDDEEPLAFDQNPGWRGFFIGILLGMVVLILNIVVVSIFSLSLLPTGFAGLQGIHYNSVLFVPQFFSTAQVGQQSILDNSVFEIILTAPGEEGLKAALLYGMFLATKSELVSVAFSDLIWASFHTILVSFTWPEVLLAAISGAIWYGGWKATNSILTPILSHGAYDALIVALSSSRL